MTASKAVFLILLSSVGTLSGCATEDASCSLNDTRSCQCAGGATGAQTCDANGDWAVCACASGGGGGGGGGGGSGSGSGGGGTVKKHGDTCATQTDCGSGTNLVCVVDHPGDSQGICRLACSTFSQCLGNPEALHLFDTACCDIGNGTSTCGNEDNWPEDACH